ncbi:MAG: Thymidylate kinase [Gammaproteobacteria bacterium]|nr:Thymidylate kinase [Gammaproteobacteria bacterium]
MSPSGVRGKFITVEGQDGAGKTTNLGQIERVIRASGYEVLRTREPGGTPLGDTIRGLVLHGGNLDIDPMAELLLIFAARAQHLNAVIRPALTAGMWVVCDRFTDATYAYQGGGRGMDVGVIGEIEQSVQQDLRPNLTLLFDVDIATGAERAGERSGHDRFESEEAAFKGRVRDAYLARARAEPDRIRVIDAVGSLDRVQGAVESIMREYIDSLR